MDTAIIVLLVMFAFISVSGGYHGYLPTTYGYAGGILMILLIVAAALLFVQ